MKQPTPNERLVLAVKALPQVETQNRLMRLSDREIALAMLYMGDRDRALLLASLPQAKAERIWGELELHKRLVIRYDQYLAAVANVVAGLEARRQAPFRSYLRPRRGQRGR